jgi:hypothetical protein
MVIHRLNPQRTIVSLSKGMTDQKHKYWFSSLKQQIYYILVDLRDLDYSGAYKAGNINNIHSEGSYQKMAMLNHRFNQLLWGLCAIDATQ